MRQKIIFGNLKNSKSWEKKFFTKNFFSKFQKKKLKPLKYWIQEKFQKNSKLPKTDVINPKRRKFLKAFHHFMTPSEQNFRKLPFLLLSFLPPKNPKKLKKVVASKLNFIWRQPHHNSNFSSFYVCSQKKKEKKDREKKETNQKLKITDF